MSASTTNSENFLQFIRTSIPAGYDELDEKQRKLLRNSGLGACLAINKGRPFYAANTTVNGVKSIYGIDWQLSFFVWHPVKQPRGLALIARWQEVSGSADDKLVHVVCSLASLQKKGKVSTAALLLDGSGARTEVKTWCADKCTKHGVLYFAQTSAFASWAGKNL